jgi:hypothetical protein
MPETDTYNIWRFNGQSCALIKRLDSSKEDAEGQAQLLTSRFEVTHIAVVSGSAYDQLLERSKIDRTACEQAHAIAQQYEFVQRLLTMGIEEHVPGASIDTLQIADGKLSVVIHCVDHQHETGQEDFALLITFQAAG